jgi:hypothetical protein
MQSKNGHGITAFYKSSSQCQACPPTLTNEISTDVLGLLSMWSHVLEAQVFSQQQQFAAIIPESTPGKQQSPSEARSQPPATADTTAAEREDKPERTKAKCS